MFVFISKRSFNYLHLQIWDDWCRPKQSACESLLCHDGTDHLGLPRYGYLRETGNTCVTVFAYTLAVTSYNQCHPWQAVGRHENLTSQNMEKKARWREEAQKEREEAAIVAEKAQWDLPEPLRLIFQLTSYYMPCNIKLVKVLMFLYTANRA